MNEPGGVDIAIWTSPFSPLVSSDMSDGLVNSLACDSPIEVIVELKDELQDTPQPLKKYWLESAHGHEIDMIAELIRFMVLWQSRWIKA
jgi:hypothetical protein